MNFETESGPRGKVAPANDRRAAGWIKNLALLLLGIVLGVGGWRVWSDVQEGRRFHLAKQKAEQLLRDAAPRADTRLAAITRQLESLESDVTQAGAAASAAAIDVSRFRLQQKRLSMNLDEVGRLLRNVTSFVEQAPQKLALGPDREVLTAEAQQQLADCLAQFERCRRDYELLGPEIELAKGRRLQLAVTEADSTRRAQTEAETVQRVQAEALRIQAEAMERAQSEATQRSTLETVRQAQNDLVQLAMLRTVQPVADTPAVPQVIPLPAFVTYANPPLVIGSSYPDRYLGSRGYWGYGYGPWGCGYSPWSYGYGSWRCGYGSWRGGYGPWRRGWW